MTRPINTEEFFRRFVTKEQIRPVQKLHHDLLYWKKTTLEDYCLNRCVQSPDSVHLCCHFERMGVGLGPLSRKEIMSVLKGYDAADGAGAGTLQDWAQGNDEPRVVIDKGWYKLKGFKICPAYAGRCTIHDNPDRPQGCSSFPIDFAVLGGYFALYVNMGTCGAMRNLDLGFIAQSCRTIEIPFVSMTPLAENPAKVALEKIV